MRDSESSPFGRRSFLKGVVGSLFGFAAATTISSPAWALAECAYGRRYRKQRAIVGQGKPICIYDYYDNKTGKFCFTEIIPC